MNWQFRHRPDREFPWETYYSPQGSEWPKIFNWCYDTFGNPSTERRWDSHGGYIKLLHESDVALFLLRWS